MAFGEPFSEDEFDQGNRVDPRRRHVDDISDLNMGKK